MVESITLSMVAGWAVAKTMPMLQDQLTEAADSYLKAYRTYHGQVTELLVLLKDPKLIATARKLDKFTDQHWEFRGDYTELCDALEEAHLLLLQLNISAAAGAERFNQAWLPIKSLRLGLPVTQPGSLVKQLSPFTDRARYESLTTAETGERGNGMDDAMAGDDDDPEGYRRYADVAGNTGPEISHECIAEQNDVEVSVFTLLHRPDREVRNVGVHGIGGIGKTTIAQKVFERARREGGFGRTCWLTVGRRVRKEDMLVKLEEAFKHMFKGEKLDAADAAAGLKVVVERLHEVHEKVLLVLDDVWQSSPVNVIQHLNFATHAHEPHCHKFIPGSRLVVTTRQRAALSYHPRRPSGQHQEMGELRVVDVPQLGDDGSKAIFDKHAFLGTKCPEFVPPSLHKKLIAQCHGNPLVLRVAGCNARKFQTKEEWKKRLEDIEKHHLQDKDSAKVLEISVLDLSPSVRDCFIDFAVFQEDASVPEADLVHMFTTHAPLYGPGCVRAAKLKLNELVQQGLVSVTTGATQLEYSMHDLLYDIAVSKTQGRQSRWCSNHGPVDKHGASQPQGVRFFSFHRSGHLPQALSSSRCPHSQLRACVMSSCIETPAAGWNPFKQNRVLRMQRLRYLSLSGDVSGLAARISRHKLPLLNFLSVSGCRGHGPADLLKCLLPAPQLAHLQLIRCTGLPETLPDVLNGCNTLTHLNLTGCDSLTKLPDSIGCCSKLAHLNLSSCKALQHLPESITTLEKLSYVNLSGCEALKSLQADGSILRIARLDLTGCRQLEAVELCTDRLTHLNLDRCRGLAQVPPLRSEYLHQLIVSRCSKILTQLPSLAICGRLTRLDLSRCKGLTELPQGIGSCTELAHLDLTGCKRITELPGTIGACSKLAHVNLSRCKGLRSLPVDLFSCKGLERLNLRGCKVLEDVPEAMLHWQCTNLTDLNVARCPRMPPLPTCIVECSRITIVSTP